MAEISKTKKVEIMDLKAHTRDGVGLCAAELGSNCPFCVKRAFWIFGAEIQQNSENLIESSGNLAQIKKRKMPSNAVRGEHANKFSEFLMLALSGSCEVKAHDGKIWHSVLLNDPTRGLYLGKNTWKIMQNFSRDCVLLVLASEVYSEADYIRDFSEFLAACEAKSHALMPQSKENDLIESSGLIESSDLIESSNLIESGATSKASATARERERERERE